MLDKYGQVKSHCWCEHLHQNVNRTSGCSSSEVRYRVHHCYGGYAHPPTNIGVDKARFYPSISYKIRMDQYLVFSPKNWGELTQKHIYKVGLALRIPGSTGKLISYIYIYYIYISVNRTPPATTVISKTWVDPGWVAVVYVCHYRLSSGNPSRAGSVCCRCALPARPRTGMVTNLAT